LARSHRQPAPTSGNWRRKSPAETGPSQFGDRNDKIALIGGVEDFDGADDLAACKRGALVRLGHRGRRQRKLGKAELGMSMRLLSTPSSSSRKSWRSRRAECFWTTKEWLSVADTAPPRGSRVRSKSRFARYARSPMVPAMAERDLTAREDRFTRSVDRERHWRHAPRRRLSRQQHRSRTDSAARASSGGESQASQPPAPRCWPGLWALSWHRFVMAGAGGVTTASRPSDLAGSRRRQLRRPEGRKPGERPPAPRPNNGRLFDRTFG
jgi:hypothetical protein